MVPTGSLNGAEVIVMVDGGTRNQPQVTCVCNFCNLLQITQVSKQRWNCKCFSEY